MSDRRKVRVAMTVAEAEALFGYAVEGQEDEGARSGTCEATHPATRAAGERALRRLGHALAAARGHGTLPPPPETPAME